jgi:translation elongation factor EF-Ts
MIAVGGVQRYQQAISQLVKKGTIFGMQVRPFSQVTISAKMVKELRALTGSPLKDCMKVLDETKGDIEKAKELLRKRGLADAERRSGRATAEGYVGMKIDREASLVTFVEMTCETDFVAKTDKFLQGVECVLDTLHAQGSSLQVGQQ